MIPKVSCIVHDQCIGGDATPDNIHMRFMSKMKGILIYRVFRGNKIMNQLISPWNEELDAGYFYCPYVPLTSNGQSMSFWDSIWIGNTCYHQANIHVYWRREFWRIKNFIIQVLLPLRYFP